MENIYLVAIIGAGNIGSSWDTPTSKNILTHAHAFKDSARTKLAGIVDTDASRGKHEADKWQTPFYADIDSLFENTHPDIVVVATPDTTHAEMLERVMRSDAKLIICEKPIVTNESEVARVRKVISATSIPIIVNFPRQFDATVVRLREELMGGAHGEIVSAHAIYAKGTHHIGSHLFDLLRFLFGELTGAAAHFKIDDYAGDPTFGGVASFERCGGVYIQAMDSRATSILELDILTDKKRIRFTDNGHAVETQGIIPDPVYAGFRTFGPMKREASELEHALPELARHAIAVLDGKEPARSTTDNALKTFETCQRFASSFKPI